MAAKKKVKKKVVKKTSTAEVDPTPRKTKMRNGRIVTVEEEPGQDELDLIFQEVDKELKELQFDNMDKEDILVEIQKVDRELLAINGRLNRLAKTRRHVFKGDADALNLQLRTLKQRSDMLFKCLDKVMPDKRESTVHMNLNTTAADQIPDDILAKFATGTLTQEEYEHYSHLLEKDFKENPH